MIKVVHLQQSTNAMTIIMSDAFLSCPLTVAQPQFPAELEEPLIKLVHHSTLKLDDLVTHLLAEQQKGQQKSPTTAAAAVAAAAAAAPPAEPGAAAAGEGASQGKENEGQGATGGKAQGKGEGKAEGKGGKKAPVKRNVLRRWIQEVRALGCEVWDVGAGVGDV